MSAKLGFASGVPGSIPNFSARLLTVLIAAYCVWQTAAVDVVVWTTNDTSTYLVHSSDFSTYGTVIAGYRTMGYPLFLRFTQELSAFLPIDGLFTAVLLQRLLLGLGLFAAVLILRGWSLPVVLFLANPMIMSFTNLIGPEALLVSLGLIFALVTLVIYRWALEVEKNYRRIYVAYALLCLLFVYICTIKITMAPFGLLLAATWLRVMRASSSSARDGRRGTAVLLASLLGRSWPVSACLALATAGLVTFLAATSLENRAEYGTLSPAANVERSRFWGVYTLIFSVPENRAAPSLAPFFDGGSPYTYLHGIECIGAFATPSCVRHTYEDRIVLLDNRVEEMIAAAGVRPLALQLQGAIAVFGGGRMDDLGSGIRQVMLAANSSHDVVPTARINNIEVQNGGLEQFLARHNYGRQPSAIDGLGFPDFLGYHPRTLQSWLLIPILCGLLFVLANRDWRIFGLASLASFVIVASAMGFGFVDIWRYIVPSWSVLAVTTMGALASLARRSTSSAGTRRIADVPG